MSSWTDLPTEIIVSIFRNLHSSEGPNRALQQCCLTCRQWRQSSRKLLFSKVTFKTKEDVMNVIAIFREDPSLAKHVKILDLKKVAQLGAPIIEYFSGLFTNLEEFRFRNTDINYNNFCKVICKGGFLYLETIPLPKTAGQNEWYLKLLEVKKNVISSIKFGDDRTLGCLKDKLHEFPALKTLFIVLMFRDARCFMNYVEEITEKNKLQSVEAITINVNAAVNRRNFLRNLNNVQPMPNVMLLKIDGIGGKIVIDDVLMRYVMKKFPNLTHFSIDMNLIETEDLEFHRVLGNISLSVDVAVEFFNYVSKMHASLVESVPTKERTGEIIERFCSANSNKESLCYPRLELTCSVERGMNELGDLNLPVVTLRADRRGSKIRTIAVDFGRGTNLAGQELELLVERVGKYFKIIKLDCVDHEYFTALGCIAKHCTRLETLTIEDCPEISLEDYQGMTPNQSLTKVELKQTAVSTELFSYIAHLFPRMESLFFTNYDHARNKAKKDYILELSNTPLKHLEMVIGYHHTLADSMILNDGVCVKVLTEKKEDYLLFGFVEDFQAKHHMITEGMEFRKHLTVSEFNDLENYGRYYMYNIHCKSLEKISVGYISRDSDLVYEEVSY